MIYELRIYRLHPGKRPAFVKQFRKARKFMKKYGVTFVAAWETDRDDEFAWMRSFASHKARDKAIEAYYSSPEWMRIVDDLRPMIRRREVRVMNKVTDRGSLL
jgi:rRNA maturation protein Rpf1